MTNAQDPADSETCQCADQEKITKSGAFKTQGTWIHMANACGKPLPQGTKERLQLT